MRRGPYQPSATATAADDMFAAICCACPKAPRSNSRRGIHRMRTRQLVVFSVKRQPLFTFAR